MEKRKFIKKNELMEICEEINGELVNGQYESFEMLEVKAEDIEEKVFFVEGELVFSFKPEDVRNTENWREIGGLAIPVEDLKGHWMIDNCVVDSSFMEMVFQTIDPEDVNLTEEDIEKQFEKIEKDHFTVDDLDKFETYTYWDGSNHQEITLNDADRSEWVEIDYDEEGYQVEEELEYDNHGTGITEKVKMKNGDIYKIEKSFYQGVISDTWIKMK